MSILVDTSVWVQHFRDANPSLAALLSLDLALIHPMIVIDLSCGTPPAPRSDTLGNISLLRHANQATTGEVLDFIEREKSYGLGCGLVDLTLLASTLITPGAKL